MSKGTIWLNVACIGGTSSFMGESWLGPSLAGANRKHYLNGGRAQFNPACIMSGTAEANPDQGRISLEQAKYAYHFADSFCGGSNEHGRDESNARIKQRIADGFQGRPFDVLFCLTRDNTHPEFLEAALDARVRQLLSEKCLAHTYGAAKAITEKVAASGSRGYVMYNYVMMAVIEYLQDLVAKKLITKGQYKAIIKFLQGWGRKKKQRKNWRFLIKQCGPGGVLGDLGTHIIRVIRWVLSALGDPIVAVKAGKVGFYTGCDETVGGSDFKIIYPGDEGWDDIDPMQQAVDCGEATLVTASGAEITFETGRHYLGGLNADGVFEDREADFQLELHSLDGERAAKWALHRQDELFLKIPGEGERIDTKSWGVPGLRNPFTQGHEQYLVHVLEDADNGCDGEFPADKGLTSFGEATEVKLVEWGIRESGLNGGKEVNLAESEAKAASETV